MGIFFIQAGPAWDPSAVSVCRSSMNRISVHLALLIPLHDPHLKMDGKPGFIDLSDLLDMIEVPLLYMGSSLASQILLNI